jgi:hypothetical protein
MNVALGLNFVVTCMSCEASCSWLLLTQNNDKFFTFGCIFHSITRARAT